MGKLIETRRASYVCKKYQMSTVYLQNWNLILFCSAKPSLYPLENRHWKKGSHIVGMLNKFCSNFTGIFKYDKICRLIWYIKVLKQTEVTHYWTCFCQIFHTQSDSDAKFEDQCKKVPEKYLRESFSEKPCTCCVAQFLS